MSFNDFYHKFFGGRKDNNSDSDFDSNRIRVDLFEMHDVLEKTINEVFKSVLNPNLFHDFDDLLPKVPAIEENLNPRDFYLKPEFNQTKPENENLEKHVGKGTWLDQLLPSPNQHEPLEQPRNFSSFRSVIRKSITLPDGTVQTEEIVRNSDGTEQRTVTETVPDGNNPPSTWPGFSGFFGPVHVPQINKCPKYDFLKPGYENFSSQTKKVDKDLDKEILDVGFENIHNFSNIYPDVFKRYTMPEPKQDVTVKSFTKRTVTLPNGVVESEEIIRNSDGTEQRSSTKTLLDQTPVHGAKIESGFNVGQSFTLKAVKDLLNTLFK